MTLKSDIIELERRLKSAGADLDAVLRSAKVDRSTFTRWKNGSVKGARYDTISRVHAAADRAIAREKRRAESALAQPEAA